MNVDWYGKELIHIRQMETWLEPQRHIQELMEQWHEPQRRLQEQIEKLLEPQRRMQEQMELWLEPQRRAQEQMDKLLEPHRRAQEQMEKLLEPQRRMHEQLEQLLEPQRHAQEQMERWLEPQRLLQEQMDKWLEPQRQFQGIYDRWQQTIDLEEYAVSILSKTQHESLTINQGGTISIEGDTLSVRELSEAYSGLLESIAALPSPGQAAGFIWGYLQKIRRPIMVLLLIVILPFIINIASNLSTPQIEQILRKLSGKPGRVEMKGIRAQAEREFSPNQLQDYRFVSTQVLNVRNGPSTRHQVIDEIYFGQVTRLIKKGKNWSSIGYTNEGTYEELTGWVFSRYLLKFRK